MSLLAQLLYDNTPRPLPTAAVIRLHTTANDDDAHVPPTASDLAAYYCGSCHGSKKQAQMYVKKDGNIGAQCKACHERQSAKKSLRRR